MVRTKFLSRSGAEWLKAACDPFHDMTVDLTGFPDSSNDHSIVQKIIQSDTVESPFAAGVKWDCLFFMVPIFSTGAVTTRGLADFAGGVIHWNSLDGTSGNNFSLGFIVQIVVPAGTSIKSYNDILAASGTITGHPCLIDQTMPSRVIAGGFEVVNTTPEIYKGGSCTVGTFEPYIQHGVVPFYDDAAVAALGYNETFFLKQWPQNISSAMKHPSSVTWEAEKGCYVPLRFNSVENLQFQQPRQNRFVAVSNLMCNTVGSVGGTVSAAANWYYQHTAASYAYFTGLSDETTLRLVHMVYVESAPNWNTAYNPVTVTDSTMLPSVTPAARYDPRALTLYGQVLPTLPAGCPRTLNPSGEWWSQFILKGVKVALDAATPVAAALDPVAYGVPSMAVGAMKLAQRGGQAAVNAILKAKGRGQPQPRPAPRLTNVPRNRPRAKKKSAAVRRFAANSRML